jgi:multiple sugar transport system permease protein
MATATSRTATTTTEPARASRARGTAASYDSRNKLFNRVCLGVLIAFSLIWLIPIAWAVDTALKPNAETTKVPTTWFIENPTVESFRSVLSAGDIWKWYLSSFITSTAVAAGAVLTASMAAYALSRLRFRGRRWWFLFVLAGIMIPQQVLVVPLFREFDALNLLNTYWAVILPQIPTVVSLFVFKQFFDGIPHDFEESARLDGAGFWRTFRSIIMPLSRPVIAAMSIVTFVGTWNNLILPLFVLSNPKLMTIPVGLATVQGSFGQRLSDIQASSILGALPLVILFLIFQRQIVEGFAGSGLKG